VRRAAALSCSFLVCIGDLCDYLLKDLALILIALKLEQASILVLKILKLLSIGQ